MSNDTAECGCEGHADNFGDCKYPKVIAALKSVIQDLEDRLADVDPDPSPMNGTRHTLQNRIAYLKKVIK